ncbi:hypothetical protein JMM61_18885 [Rhodovulum sulfidophilum]|uniref:peptidoglycan-binding domain-containing protein n=1 Tax=Rhodovulum sulfidophilum TaxID=35806 RepID=UPI001926DB73|nr:hypothetical protein [Rhodovulum sulfidophilum]MBL3587414.1 hypothetical protein [Rhodovulum sulfidophilum]
MVEFSEAGLVSSVRLSASLFTSLNPTILALSRGHTLLRSDQEAMILASDRSVIFSTLLQALAHLGLIYNSPSMEELIQVRVQSPSEILSAQMLILERYGVRKELSHDEYSIDDLSIPGIHIRVDVRAERYLEGSLGKRSLVVLDIITNNAFVAAVLAPLVLSACTALWMQQKINGNHDFVYEKMYICTVGDIYFTSIEKINSEAIRILSTQTFESNDHQKDVWKARQSCLKAVGVYLGEVDGIYGVKTKAAEDGYSKSPGGVAVNWSSKNFAAHLIEHAKIINQKEKTPDVNLPHRRRH